MVLSAFGEDVQRREGLAILQLTTEGLLPAGRHQVDLAEMEEVFVRRAPHREEREVIFSAFKIYLSLLRGLVSRGTLWVDGGFCTYKESAPKDIDLVMIIDPDDLQGFGADEWQRLAQLLTLQGVAAAMPAMNSQRLQPMGGLLDAFFIITTDFDAEKFWDETWSSVKAPDGTIIPGAIKGYLELSWQ